MVIWRKDNKKKTIVQNCNTIIWRNLAKKLGLRQVIEYFWSIGKYFWSILR